ncbi:hypothetical protein SAMN05421831_105140 [Allopseudospirillum japonicum]|uniref:Uncharacterized protein n=1 Tax=Allopseudospirillum japonicum TaxID=64971 RepID=A0A1H6S0J3_9GAMM|nr:hypothetical protein [Allopseudospirillum japonicum]SEI61471.1 hypothetical protein SAMN05421831_105140 [Allopseudospirillum japonicum]
MQDIQAQAQLPVHLDPGKLLSLPESRGDYQLYAYQDSQKNQPLSTHTNVSNIRAHLASYLNLLLQHTQETCPEKARTAHHLLTCLGQITWSSPAWHPQQSLSFATPWLCESKDF